jgi:hypothetical protein
MYGEAPPRTISMIVERMVGTGSNLEVWCLPRKASAPPRKPAVSATTRPGFAPYAAYPMNWRILVWRRRRPC